MTSEEKKDPKMFSNKTAFVVGYTGEVGKQLTRELLQRKVFGKVILVGRRSVEVENPSGANVVSGF